MNAIWDMDILCALAHLLHAIDVYLGFTFIAAQPALSAFYCGNCMKFTQESSVWILRHI